MALAGCASATASTTKSATRAPQPTATVTATPFATANPTPLDLGAAWGNVAITRLPSLLDEGHVFVFDEAATPDGQWLIGAIEPRNFIDNTTEPSFATLYNVSTRQLLKIQQLQRPQSQILFASADEHWIVWSEADDQPSFFDWTLFAYNRQTGQTRQLAQAVKGADGKAVQGPYPSPVVNHDHVVWSQPIGPVTPQTIENVVAQMEDLTTGAVTQIATKAGSPALSWPWLLWDQVTTNADGYVTIKNIETGQEQRLNEKPITTTIVGNSVAYDDGYSVNLLDDIRKGTTYPRRLLSAANSGEHLQFVTLNDRLVAWTAYQSVMVYDRVQQRLVTLPTTAPHGFSAPYVSGPLLVWSDPEPQDQIDQDRAKDYTPALTLQVIDTRTLPAAPSQ